MLRYAITDRIRLAANESERQSALLAQASHLAAAGVDFIQLREKDLSAAALADLARRLLAVLRTHQPAPRLLINSRADVALATRADGVHLSSSPDALTPAEVRALYAAAALPEPIISLSCHTLAEVVRAASTAPENRPTHILFGPIYEKVVAMNSHSIMSCHSERSEESPHSARYATASSEGKSAKEAASKSSIVDKKVCEGAGLDLLRTVCLAATPIPVLALGGITKANAAATLAAEAAGIAAIRLFLK